MIRKVCTYLTTHSLMILYKHPPNMAATPDFPTSAFNSNLTRTWLSILSCVNIQHAVHTLSFYFYISVYNTFHSLYSYL